MALRRRDLGAMLLASLVTSLSGQLLTTGRPSTAAAADELLPTAMDPRLLPVFKADRVWNAVTTTRDGRVFVGYPQAAGRSIQVEELTVDGSRPFPDYAWNTWSSGQDPVGAFVHVNAVRIGPDGALWVVDAGAPGIGRGTVPGAARIIRIDLLTNQVARVYPLAAALRSRSYPDDVRFHGDIAYVTDAGAPGLIVLDLRSGTARRVLDDNPATVDSRSMYADGKLLRNERGEELRVHADQLEVSPDGATLYFQPASGPMARIGTAWLDDPALAPADLASHVEIWLDTPTTGGTAIDAAGNIYLSDTNRRRILKITPTRDVTTLIADPRLIWSDAMWIDHEDYLWIPATQQNLTPGFDDGLMAVRYPVWIYKMRIGAGPSPIDHA